jgi:hypothetical protein
MEGTSYVFLHLCEYLVYISCKSAIINFCLFNLVIKMGKKSHLWDYFKRIPDDSRRVVCGTCQNVVSCSGNTTNMKIHLQRHHKSLFEQLVAREADGTNNTQPEQSSPTVSEVPRPTVSEVPCPTGISRQEVIQRRRSQRASPYPRTVQHFDQNDPFMSGFKVKLVDFIAKDLQPLSVVEDSGFVGLMEFVEPRLKLPSRSTLTCSWLPEVYESEKIKLKSLLANVQFVSLTCDLWSSIAHDSKLTVTCHFIDSELKLHSHVLETISIPERHTSLNLSIRLIEIAKCWGIENKVACVVTDNASNIVNAIKECGWEHISCFAHTAR